MCITIKPVGDSFVREVEGIRLWEPLDEHTTARLHEAWSEAGVLIFRRQALSEREMVDFFGRFGELAVIVRTDWQSKNRPEAIHISNMKDAAGRSIGGLGSGELDWHTDQSYVMNPATGALLYMVEMPPEGGRTYWANLQLAYEDLPEATKRRIAGRSAIYDYIKRQSTYDDEKPMSEELRRKTPPVLHPIVNEHPVTGRKSLYLDPTTAVGIAEMPEEEGKVLLDELNMHATRPEFVYCHDWQIGDVVMWDNGVLLHRRDPFDASQCRWLKRLTARLAPTRHVVPASELAAG